MLLKEGLPFILTRYNSLWCTHISAPYQICNYPINQSCGNNSVHKRLQIQIRTFNWCSPQTCVTVIVADCWSWQFSYNNTKPRLVPLLSIKNKNLRPQVMMMPIYSICGRGHSGPLSCLFKKIKLCPVYKLSQHWGYKVTQIACRWTWLFMCLLHHGICLQPLWVGASSF